MKYKTRQLRNLSFRQIVKRKNKKTRKTNANVTSYLNKRIMHKNRRHIQYGLLKNTRKKTRKIQSGGLEPLEGLLVGGVVIAVVIFIAMMLWCAMPTNRGCGGVMELVGAFVGGAGASRPYYRKRGNILNKYLVSMTSLFKRREAQSMERSIYSLLQILQKRNERNDQLLNLLKSNAQLNKMCTIDQINLLIDILKPQSYEDFSSRIAMFAQQLNGDFTPDLKKFLSTNIIFSAAIKNKKSGVAKKLMEYIAGNGEKNSSLSIMLSNINPMHLSITPLITMLTDLTRNPNAIKEVVENGVNSGNPLDTDTDDTDTDTDLHAVAGVLSDNLDEKSEMLTKLASKIAPQEEAEIRKDLDEANSVMLSTALLEANKYDLLNNSENKSVDDTLNKSYAISN